MSIKGRPRALDEIKQREICALISAGCAIREAARYVGCAPSTIHREARRNNAFGERLRQSSTYAQLGPMHAMQHAAKTHWRAAAWFLERTRPGRFARRGAAGFSPRQARALGAELMQVLERENIDPMVGQRLLRRIQATVECAIVDACGTEQARRNQRRAIAFYAHLDRNSDVLVQAGIRPPQIDDVKEALGGETMCWPSDSNERRQPRRSPRREPTRFVEIARGLSSRLATSPTPTSATGPDVTPQLSNVNTATPSSAGAQNEGEFCDDRLQEPAS